MNEETTNDLLKYDDNGKAILPTGINVLTILTIIACSLGACFYLLMPVIVKWALGFLEKATNQDMSPKKLEDLHRSIASLELYNQNMIPLIALGLVGIILCFVGALWMRKLKKDGYWMYLAGEIAPLLGGFLIMGTTQFASTSSYIFGIGIPLLFVILYTMQRKYLTK